MNLGNPEIWGSVITALGGIAAAWFTIRQSRKNKCDPIREDAAQSANVYAALEYTLGELGADRSYVLQFHNGGHYYSGRGQQKFSCTHEVVDEGISAEHINSQDHRISTCHSYIHELIEGEKFLYEDINEIKDSGFLRILDHKGVKSIVNVPIKTLNGKIIGILGVDYVKDAKAIQNEQFLFMKLQARIIAGYLV
jgi:hypothetical protein